MTCGRCRGRGVTKPSIGFGDMVCPKCKGTGLKPAKASLGKRKVSVPLAYAARCIVCNAPAVHNHHIVSQNRLDRILSPEDAQRAKRDRRDVVPLCNFHHDDGTLRLTPEQLPVGFWDYVAEFGLMGALPRYLEGALVERSWRFTTRSDD